MRAPLRLLALPALFLLPAAGALGVQDGGALTLQGHGTDVVERRLVLDLWDAGQPTRTFTLRVLPDSDVEDGVEARARALHGAEGAWKALGDFRLAASGDKKAQDRGWDGLYEVRVRVRLPNVERARLSLALVEEAPGTEGLVFSTALLATPVAFEAWSEGGQVLAKVGPKTATNVEAGQGASRWPLVRGADEVWRLTPRPGVAEVRLTATFADGASLEGPTVAVAARTAPEDVAADQAGGTAEGAPSPVSSAGPEDGPLSPPASPRRVPAQPPAAVESPPSARAASPPRALPEVPISLLVAALVVASLGARGTFK